MLERVSDLIWNPWLLGLFLLAGLYFSVRTGFFQLFGIKTWWKATVGKLFSKQKRKKGSGLTQFQALSTALASTIGTGSIAGVATAIFYGGPGAVFWMWVSAFLGLMTSFVEKTLAVRYRRRSAGGGWEGGPMEYLERGLRCKPLAVFFSICCIGASLSGGALVQTNSIAAAFRTAFGWDQLAVGAAVALAAALVIKGGIGGIGRASEKLVPVMALLFLAGGGAVIATHAAALPGALREIVGSALTPQAALGGGLGYGMAAALRYGVARGVFTNEAGIGSSAMAHAAADVDDPAEEGCWGMLEVFIATLVVCSVTALAILTSGVYDAGAALSAVHAGTVTADMAGVGLSAAAFGTVFGPWGGVLVAVCLLLFAFTSLLGWSYYGERGLFYLTGSNRHRPLFRVLFLGAVLLGSVGDLASVWQLSDVCNGLMALPNLIALLALSGEALAALDRFVKK